jgi:hypothetical protein
VLGEGGEVRVVRLGMVMTELALVGLGLVKLCQ